MSLAVKRTVTWIGILFICFPFLLMISDPDLFTVFLRFVLHYYLELILPVLMHAYGLWVSYSRRSNQLGRFAFWAFCGISIVSFSCLSRYFTYQVFWGVTVMPGLYVIVSDLLSGKSNLLAKNDKGR